MENVKVNSVNSEVGMSLRNRISKEDKFLDFTCFLMNMIEMDEDAGYSSLENYKLGEDCFERELVKYAFNENSIWEQCFEVAGVKNLNEFEIQFKNVHFCEGVIQQ
ncbi:hypothetical protein [Clostridium beijerinckii]|uniref:Uncharacterized protein n=1 Tax=Clostridium beijerinckii TaxID=1520 RepID=A0AB74VDC4_CLOBE|nr:hypothetical protein [Clostridium beijerinckii]NRZ28764.1 hypothetical protein [Clostridium beijerinckii]NYB95460.1 hypothetical protein [Clostridium beijerinckii]QUN34441.1 hypothetical protein KEC93_21335 [Clostridium beijerinckii]